jgi:hypothetical protein
VHAHAARLGRLLARLTGLVGGLLSLGTARAVDLPQDHAEAMVHLYDGGGTKAYGPALLVRKSIADKFSVTGEYFVDMVSNASIDVVTQASKYHEVRNEFGLSADYVVRDTKLTLGSSISNEPDYRAHTTSLDLSQEVFGGMTTMSLGFSYGNDTVGKKANPNFTDTARHWQYRLGATQILTPRWLLSANYEAIDDDGYLGSPYRSARVFGAYVPENDPRTRASQALELRTVGDIGDGPLRQSVHASWRLFKDTWGIHANTFELGTSKYFAGGWLGEGFLRYYSQKHALFYSDNATTETLYISRNRQLSTFHDIGLGLGASRVVASAPGHYEVTLRGNYELVKFSYKDFTDPRTNQAYRNDGHVLQLQLSASF